MCCALLYATFPGRKDVAFIKAKHGKGAAQNSRHTHSGGAQRATPLWKQVLLTLLVLVALLALLGGALWLQILLFLAVSAVILALTRPLVKKMAGHVQPTNLDQTIGASARVTEDIDDAAGTGAVYVKGKMWTARSSSGATIPIGTEVTVERIEGVKLYVTPVRAEVHRG